MKIFSNFVAFLEYINFTVKFRYSGKAQNLKQFPTFFEITSKSGRCFEIFVDFSQYLNFIGIHLRLQIFFYFIVWLSGAEPSSHWGCCPRLTLRPQRDIIGALSTLHMWQKNLHSRLCFACCYISTLRFQISVHWRGMRISISGNGRELEVCLTSSIVSRKSLVFKVIFAVHFFILLRCRKFSSLIKNWNVLQYLLHSNTTWIRLWHVVYYCLRLQKTSKKKFVSLQFCNCFFKYILLCLLSNFKSPLLY